ncbi:MAG: hypothetical protein ACLFWL_13695 [Candidatus Brocadiia bacterium]|nr:hypothetical protein [Planctomycetota bacterium]
MLKKEDHLIIYSVGPDGEDDRGLGSFYEEAFSALRSSDDIPLVYPGAESDVKAGAAPAVEKDSFHEVH